MMVIFACIFLHCLSVPSPPAQETERAEPAASEVFIRVVARPLAEVCAAIGRQTGLSIEVEDRITGWKTTIAYRGPVSRILDALALNFGLKITRVTRQNHPEEETAAYRLALTDQEVERLENLERLRAKDAAELARRDSAAMKETLRRLLERPGPQAQRTEEGEVSPMTTGAEPILDLIQSMGPAFLDRIVTSQRFPVPDYEKSPTVTVPVSSLSPGQRSLLRSFFQRNLEALHASEAGHSAHAERLARMTGELDSARIGFWVLNNGIGQTLHLSVYLPGVLWSPDFPLIHSDATPDLGQAPARHQQAKNPGASALDPQPEAAIDVELDNQPYAEAVLKVAQACGVPVVADSFCLPVRATGKWRGQPKSVVLDAVCRQLGLERRWQDGILLLCSNDWETLLSEEPSAAALDALAAAIQEGSGITWDVLASMACSMKREHLRGLSRWWSPKGASGASAANVLRSRFPVWQWLGSLRRDQQSDLVKRRLRVAFLSPVQLTGLRSLAASAGVPAPSTGALLRLVV